MRVVEISRTKLRVNRTLIAMAWRMLAAAGIVLMEIVRMVGIVEDAVGGPAEVGGIVDAVDAADGQVVVGEIADAAGLAGGDTRNSLPRIFADSHG